jgi:hypothetical protein
MRALKLALVLLITFICLGPRAIYAESSDKPTIQEPEGNTGTNQRLPQIVDCDSDENIAAIILKYGEVPIASMVVAIQIPSGQVLEAPGTFFANPSTLSYSIVASFPGSGRSCIIGMGRDFRPYGGAKPSKGTVL